VELRRGFKQTEAGVVPEDWKATRLKGLVAIEHGFGFQSRYFRAFGEYRLMTPGHFHETGGFRDVGEKQKFYEGPIPSEFLLHEQDLIVAMTEQADGLLGSAAFVPSGATYLHNQRLGKVRILSPGLSSAFLYRVFNSRGYRAKVRETAAGTKVTHTSPSKLLDIPVALPPTKAEQESITEVLRDADALVESLEQLLGKKRHIKQGVMQELLTGKKRLPGFEIEVGFKQTDIGSIPKDWEVTPMADLFTFQNGVNADKSAYGFGVPFINVLEVITHANIDLANIPGRIALSAQIINQFSVRKGDLLFNRTSETQDEVGLASVYLGADLSVFVGFVIRARPRKRVGSRFMSQSLRSRVVRAQIVALGQGAVRANIGQQDLSRVQLALPGVPEQEAIGSVLVDLEAEVQVLEAKLAKARLIKQGMTKQLLTGAIRLPLDERRSAE
jgi:type I restriction enzyme, S subunit